MEYVRKIKLLLLLIVIQTTSLFSNGVLSKIVILEKGKNSATLELHIKERVVEEVNDFDKKIKNEDIYVDPEYVGEGTVLILDKISLGKVSARAISKLGFVDRLTFKQVEGSFKDKTLLVNEKGRKYHSTRCIFESKGGIEVKMLEREKNDGEALNFRIRISSVSKGESNKDLNPYLFKKYEKISTYDTRNPLAKVVEQEDFSIKRKDLINKIKTYEENKYITAIHQLINIQASEAMNLVKNQLSPDGKIVQSADTDILVITDQKPYVLNVLQILGQVDKQAPEVQIEVKIIELQEGVGRQLGVNWKGNKQSGNRKGTLGFDNAPGSSSKVHGVHLPSNLLNGVIVDGIDALTVSISALIQKGQAKIMAEPKLLVANNKTGNFKMTEKHPILVRRSINLSQSSVTSDKTSNLDENSNNINNTLLDQDTVYPQSLAQVGATNYLDKDEKRTNTISKNNINKTNEIRNTSNRNENYSEVLFETGITLTVTPSIRKSGVIRLQLNPKITEMSENINSDSPSLSVREIDTVAYVGDGDTLLIGGLMYDKEENSVSGVPVLSKIPALGRLFKNKQTKKTKTELIFLVKTRVVRL
jgi:Flp pilus assembly secretin CpaC